MKTPELILENIQKEQMLSLYKTMVRIRVCEESLVQPILEGNIRTPCHLYSGEEAVAAGVCACLNDSDNIFGSHRSHGHFLAKGGSMNAMVAEIYCREDGCSRGRGGSMHLTDPSVGMLGSAPIVAGTISLGLGAALASSIRKDGSVAVSFFGDGATGEGVLYEAMNFAALRNLPIIFACENNLYSTHLSIRECRPDQPIAEIAAPFGIWTRRLDGNNVLEVYAAASEAVARCRAGDGPVFLEFGTYRMRGHVGPDDNIQGTHTDIRPEEEIEHWRSRDPIQWMKSELITRGFATEEELQTTFEQVTAEVESAHEFAKKSATPKKEEINKNVFAS